jgi:LPXTG-site transpeptidase (sortase) family protein
MAALLGAVVVTGCSGDSTGAAHEPSASTPTTTRSSEAPPAEPVLPMPRSAPVRVRVPAIGVSSGLMRLGLLDDGSLEVPPGAFPAGWYTGAPTPGELGPAIIAGHVQYNEDVGVFRHLSDVQPGDRVVVARSNGSAAVFQVTRVEQYAKSAFPTRAVYGNIDHAGLRLITCGGLNTQTDHYDDNTVVFADLVAARPTGG